MIPRFLPFLIAAFILSPSLRQLPNILWVVVEDQSKHYCFNGEPLVKILVLYEDS